jgi:hypothetical protein
MYIWIYICIQYIISYTYIYKHICIYICTIDHNIYINISMYIFLYIIHIYIYIYYILTHNNMLLIYWFRQRIYFGVEQLWMLQAAGQHHTRTAAPREPNRLTWKLSRRQNGGFIIFLWWFISKCLNFHVTKFWITLIAFYFIVHSIRTFYDFVDLLMILKIS